MELSSFGQISWIIFWKVWIDSRFVVEVFISAGCFLHDLWDEKKHDNFLWCSFNFIITVSQSKNVFHVDYTTCLLSRWFLQKWNGKSLEEFYNNSNKLRFICSDHFIHVTLLSKYLFCFNYLINVIQFDLEAAAFIYVKICPNNYTTFSYDLCSNC